MTVEWRKFADDCGLPEYMTASDTTRLAQIFDAHNPQSPWSRAVATLGLSTTPPADGIMQVHDGQPHIHWGYMVTLISGGTAQWREGTITTSYHPAALWRLMASQWRVSRYVLARISTDFPIPEDDEGQIIESLALGICILALTMRLKNMDEQAMALALRDPASCPAAIRQTIKQIQAIQVRRTLLSPAWARLFPQSHKQEEEANQKHVSVGDMTRTEWRGIGVCGNDVVGRAVVVDKVRDFTHDDNNKDALVLIFPRARPETVELFTHAVAVLYGDGGVMSHACTIARETNLPCVTALTQDFVASLRGNENVWVAVCPTDGRVQILDGKAP